MMVQNSLKPATCAGLGGHLDEAVQVAGAGRGLAWERVRHVLQARLRENLRRVHMQPAFSNCRVKVVVHESYQLPSQRIYSCPGGGRSRLKVVDPAALL